MSSQLREVTRGQNSERETATPEMSQRLLDAVSRQRKYQLRHKRVGLCYDCSRPVASGTLFCELLRCDLNLLGPTVTLRVSEDSSLWNIHFASDFAKANPGRVRGLHLFPDFRRDLSAHTL